MRSVLILLLSLAAARAEAPAVAAREGLLADERAARDDAEETVRRWARTDPAGAMALFDGLDLRGRATLVRAIAAAGTRHAAMVALARANDPEPEIFRALLDGLIDGGQKALFAQAPDDLEPQRKAALESVRLRWRFEAEVTRLKGQGGLTGHYEGQFKRILPLGPAVLPLMHDIVADRAHPLPGEGAAGPYRPIHPGIVRYEHHELRSLMAYGFGEIVDKEDTEAVERVYRLWQGYWTKSGADELDWEKYELGPSLAYSLHDLGVPQPAQRWIEHNLRQQGQPGYLGLRAWWNLGYAYIRIGQIERGRAYYERLLDFEQEGLSRHVAAYNLACSFSMLSRKDPERADFYRKEAVRCLTRAVELKWSDWKWMEEDGDLAAIRDEPGYKKLLATLQAKYPERPPLPMTSGLKDLLGQAPKR